MKKMVSSRAARCVDKRDPQVLRREVVYRQPWFQVVAKQIQYAGGIRPKTYFSVKGSGYCTVLALTPEKKIVLVRQYRPIVERFTLELPSGCVEKGEAPRNAMERELMEETGYRPAGKKMELLGVLDPDSGRLENNLWCYFAEEVRPSRNGGKSEDGIETVLCTMKELQGLVLKGDFAHAPHIGLIGMALIQGRIGL